MDNPKPLIRQIDCLRLYVPDLDAGVAFYCAKLGHEIIWRTDTAVGLRLPESDAEIVLQNEDDRAETDLTVVSADDAATQIVSAGGTVLVAPFDIQIGRCVVVRDPFGNTLVLLDTSAGLLKTDEHKRVIGNGD